jgi:phosphohistidine phosphatase
MKVYLMQHGKPVPEEVNPDRPLSDEGRREVMKVSEFLGRIGLQVDAVFHSGKTRARQTGEIVAARLSPETRVEERTGLSPMSDVKPAATEIQASQRDLFIAGHLPHLAKLVSLLLTGSETPAVVRFQQGGVVCLEKDEAGKWSVVWMVVPEIVV